MDFSFKDALLALHAPEETICVSFFRSLNGERPTPTERFYAGVDAAAAAVEKNFHKEHICAIWTNLQRLKPGSDRRRKGETVDAYTNIVVDIDRKVKKDADGNKVNATDEERAVLHEVAEKIAGFLAKWLGAAVFADSGNGYHLSWRLSPTDLAGRPIPTEEAQQQYRELLAMLRGKFESPDVNVEIDLSLADDTQVITVWGTWNRKYPDLLDRPQRQSRLLFRPTPQKQISLTDILLCVAENPVKGKPSPSITKASAKADNVKANPEWLENHGVEDLVDFWSGHVAPEGEAFEKSDGTYYPITPCPCHESGLHTHSNPNDCCVIEYNDGGIGIGCFSRDFGLRTVISRMNKLVGENYPHLVYAEESDEEVAKALGVVDASIPITDGGVCSNRACEYGYHRAEASKLCHDCANPENPIPEAPVGVRQDPEQQEPEQEEPPTDGKTLKYPELAFPRDAVLVPGSNLGYLVGYACKGGDEKPDVLDPGLVTEAILTLASGLPWEDEMLDTRVSRYSVLLAVSRGGKGMAWRRAEKTLGLRDKADFQRYSPSGHVQMIYALGDTVSGKKPNQTRMPGPRKMVWITEELSGCLKMAAGDGSKIMQQLLEFYDNNYFPHTDTKTGRLCQMDCRLSWGACLAIGYGEIEERKFAAAFTDSSNDGLIGRMSFGFSEKEVDSRDLEGWTPPAAMKYTEIEGVGDDKVIIESYGECAAARITEHVVKGWEPGVFEAYRAYKMPPGSEFPGWQYALKKNIVHIALVNLHEDVTARDFEAAVAYTIWQGAVRKVFLASSADDDKQAKFNEMVMKALRKADQRLARSGREEGERTIYVPRIASQHGWALRGKSLTLKNTIMELTAMGVLTTGTALDANDREVPDWAHVKAMHYRSMKCWCGETHPKKDV